MFNIPKDYTAAVTHEVVIRFGDFPDSWLNALIVTGMFLLGAVSLHGFWKFLGRK